MEIVEDDPGIEVEGLDDDDEDGGSPSHFKAAKDCDLQKITSQLKRVKQKVWLEKNNQNIQKISYNT